MRATYALTDTFSVTAGVNNGWSATSTSYGSKTGELGVGWVPNKTFSVLASAYFGKTDPNFSGNDSMKTLFDVVATYNATSQLTFILNIDINKWDDAWAQGRTRSGRASRATWTTRSTISGVCPCAPST